MSSVAVVNRGSDDRKGQSTSEDQKKQFVAIVVCGVGYVCEMRIWVSSGDADVVCIKKRQKRRTFDGRVVGSKDGFVEN